MSTQQRLYEYICDRMDSYDLERAESDDTNWNFEDYVEFKKWQKKCLKSKSEKELERLLVLMELIEDGIGNMDKESMAVFTASGFCFDKTGTLVIFSER